MANRHGLDSRPVQLPHSLLDGVGSLDEGVFSLRPPDGDPPCVVDIEEQTLTSPSAVPLSPRHSSKDSLRDRDMQRLLHGLNDLRANLVVKHTDLLQMVDQQLEEVKQISGTQGRKPCTDSSRSSHVAEDLQSSGGRPSNRSPKTFVKKDTPKGARSLSQEHSPHMGSVLSRRSRHTIEEESEVNMKSSDEDSVVFENIVPAAKKKNSQTAASIALPSLATKRRRMSWFTKQSERSGVVMRQMQASLKAKPRVARLSHREQEEAVKSAPVSGGLFRNLHNEYSVAAVRKNVEDGLEWDRMESLRAENRCMDIVRNPWFERLTMTIIFLNAVEMAINAELNEYTVLTDADPFFIAAEMFFCFFFTAELVMRYATYLTTCQAFKDMWFSFDFLLVILMNFETWVFPIVQVIGQGGESLSTANALRVARVLRVLRTARMARLVKLMPELMILVKGMLVACRSVFFTLILLLLITFVFSITFIEFSRGNPTLETHYFSSMGSSIMTLILRCILPDQEVFINSISSESWPLAALLLLFILLGSFTVMNMLLGVLVEAVKAVSTIEREQLDADFARKVLWELIDKEGDEDGDNLLSEKEFVNLLKKPKAAKALMSLGVDTTAAYDYGKLLFEDGEKASFVDFMQAMLTLRGSNKTTVKDIVELRKFLSEEFHQVETLVCELCNFLADHLELPSTSQYATPRNGLSPTDDESQEDALS